VQIDARAVASDARKAARYARDTQPATRSDPTAGKARCAAAYRRMHVSLGDVSNCPTATGAPRQCDTEWNTAIRNRAGERPPHLVCLRAGCHSNENDHADNDVLLHHNSTPLSTGTIRPPKLAETCRGPPFSQV
jgi:hypothetical protein